MCQSLLGGTGERSNGNFLQKRIPNNLPFPCKKHGERSPNVPESVHQLRPGSVLIKQKYYKNCSVFTDHRNISGDIDIVAAIGDSLTSATAANSAALWEVLVENRGLSWCIGGQGNFRTHLTLPNILKEFNPNLFGLVIYWAVFPIRNGTLNDMIDFYFRYSLQDSYNVHRTAQFNVAENIATTSDMPYNAQQLLHRMKLDKR